MFKNFLSALSLALLASACQSQDAAPLFAATLNDLDDKPVALERYRGKPLIVNFWARWCGPCRQEIPDFIKVRNSSHSKGVEILGIGIEDKADAVRDFARAYEINYPVFLAKDKGIPLMQALGNPRGGLPYTIVIDRKGQIIHTRLGAMPKAELETMADTISRK